MPLDVIVLGAPGAGKGTQATRLTRHFGIPRLSTGDILRAAVQQASPLGRAVRDTMLSGGLVEDSVMIALVTDRLCQPDMQDGVVLDGFPRTVAQAVALEPLVSTRGRPVVVHLMVRNEELTRRIISRRVCASCAAVTNAPQAVLTCVECAGPLERRSDDDLEVVRARLRTYDQQVQPLVEYFRGRPGYCLVDGTPPPDEVTRSLVSLITSVHSARQGVVT